MESLRRGASGLDGRLRREGPGMGLVRRPLERRWSERTLRKAQGRMKGGFFAYCLCTSKESESPKKGEIKTFR